MLQIELSHSLKTDIFGASKPMPKVTRISGSSMKRKLQLFLTVISMIFAHSAIAQVSFDNKEDLEKAANEFFDARKYEKAKPLFSQLLSLNALDPNYNYRFGVCILYTEADPLKPLPYIEGGASMPNVNPEAHYFLGKAFQLNYRFDDAITSYQKAAKAKLSLPGVDVVRSIEECRNGKLLYSADMQFEPAQDKEVIEGEFYRPYDFRKLKGKVIPMPPNFKTKYDEKNLKGTFVYTPSNSQVLFYASYGEDGANAKDLYRVNRLPNGEWAISQRLPDVINTKYDEDYAFFDDETQTLYFASKGHNTMGGYDVFKSVYNADKNTWSQPINLQFPVNSPYDDFLYVSDPDGKVAFFTSKRATEIGKIRVFKTLLHDPSQVELSIVEGTFEDKTDSIYNYMLASVIDPKTNQVIGKYRSNKETGKYVLVLPPQNDYLLDVGPKEASGFKFDLDVPKHEETKPLKQELEYNAQGGEGEVVMTNFFDGAGNPDSLTVAVNRPKTEVESAMVEMPDASEILAARQADQEQQRKAEEKKLAELAAAEEAKFAAEKAKQDSIIAAKQMALEAEAARLKVESARKDSIAKAEALVLAEKKKEEARQESLRIAAEKARQDSIGKAKEQALQLAAARENAVKDSLAKLEEEQLQAKLQAEKEAAIADEIAKEEALAIEQAFLREQEVADSLAKAEEIAKQIAIEEALVDSLEKVAEAERVALEEVRQKATADSLAQAKERELALAAEKEKAQADSIAQAKAEAERLAQIDREVQEAKERALRDSTVEMDVAVNTETEEESFDDLLAEMQAKEAEILAQQAAVDTTMPAVDEGEIAVNEPVELTAKDSLEAKEVISEADVFLQTIAQLEEQKKNQEAEIAAENEQIKKEKEAVNVAATGMVDTLSAEVLAEADPDFITTDNAAVEPIEVEGEKDLEVESLALQSDADPNEYLQALAAIEAEIEKDDELNGKSYELKPLPNQPVSNKEVDPVLQAKIEEDRKALAEHQRIAAEKEAALKAQMQKDRMPVDEVAVDELSELEQIEAEMLAGIEESTEPKVVTKGNPIPDKAEIEEEEIAAIVDEAESTFEESNASVETTKEVVETATQKEVESIVEEAETETMEEPAEATTQRVSELAEAELVAEADAALEEILNEEATGETDQTIDEVVEEVVEEAEVIEQAEVESELTVEPTANQSTEEIVNENPEPIASSPEEQAPPMDEAYDAEVGRIPFLTPALRNYERSKPDFNAIKDRSMKRMIQRMRAEDVGRIAVLKKMKNDWVDAGKTSEAITEIKSNVRNQEVLATNEDRPQREERIREPFNQNSLREREQVYYKLDFSLVTPAVSETVSEAMTPEQVMTFVTPEFKLESGHFQTLADARSELRYYQGRGFNSVKVVAYQNGNPISLSDVEAIPFVD
jgi:hypothetical protein